MNPLWQIVAVWLIILAALAYVGRRGWTRLRSFRGGGKPGETACASGCGSCDGGERPAAMITKPQNALVQIASTGSARRQRHQP